MPDRIATALALAKNIDSRAEKLAAEVALEISLACRGNPEFAAILLQAVGRKIVARALAAEQEGRAHPEAAGR